MWSLCAANATLQVLFTERASDVMAAAQQPNGGEGAQEGSGPVSQAAHAAAASILCNIGELSAVVEAAVSITLVHPNIVTV